MADGKIEIGISTELGQMVKAVHDGIQALVGRVEALESHSNDAALCKADTAALAKNVARIDGRLTSLVNAVYSRLDGIEQRLKREEANRFATDNAQGTGIAEHDQQIDALTRASRDAGGYVARLEQRLTALEQRLGQSDKYSGDGAAFARLEERLAALEEETKTRHVYTSDRLGDAQARVICLEHTVGELAREAKERAENFTYRLGALAERLEYIVHGDAGTPEQGENVPATLEATAETLRPSNLDRLATAIVDRVVARLRCDYNDLPF